VQNAKGTAEKRAGGTVEADSDAGCLQNLVLWIRDLRLFLPTVDAKLMRSDPKPVQFCFAMQPFEIIRAVLAKAVPHMHKHPPIEPICRGMVLICALLGLTQSASANECEELVKMHGLLGRAYSQCHFTFYSRGFVIQAEACGSKMGNKPYKQWLSEGTSAFDAKASQMGQPALCAKILKDFPYTVRQ
jgi:hypothetical protein